MNIKEQIIAANKAYRTGNAIMSDQAYDDLLEALSKTIPYSEYLAFINTLHEDAGKIKHEFVMGSLNKLKAEDTNELASFIRNYVPNKLSVSAKVDGISCHLHYEHGRLVRASTRGDGYFGEDLTDKITTVKGVPLFVASKYPQDIRGELVILKDDFQTMTGYKNPRNACAGIMNRKDWVKEDVSKVSFIAYTVLGPFFTKHDQFKRLESFGFKTAWHQELDKASLSNTAKLAELLTERVNSSFDYEVDGLVISDSYYKNEDEYRPAAQVAFKINQLTAKSRIIDVVWEGPSKSGRMVPLAIVEPVDLGGATISRATLNNVEYLENKGVQYGSEVVILKAGDIIPYIAEVKNIAGQTQPIEYPTVCPSCGEALSRDGVHLVCTNPECGSVLLNSMETFIKNLEIQNASATTLNKFGIRTIKDLLNFKANPKYKSELKFSEELETKMFTADKKTLIKAMNFNGIGTKILDKIFDAYDFENIWNDPIGFDVFVPGLPDGVGQITLDKFRGLIESRIEDVKLILADSRYNCVQQVVKVKKNGMSVCFTGSLNTMGRTEASKLAEAAGFEVKSSVSKGLTYLVNNDVLSMSSKNKKAKAIGTTIINEQQFLKMVKEPEDTDCLDNL